MRFEKAEFTVPFVASRPRILRNAFNEVIIRFMNLINLIDRENLIVR